MQSTLFDAVLAFRLAGSCGRTSPASSTPATTPSAPSWADYAAAVPPSRRLATSAGQTRVWSLDPRAAPHGGCWTPSTSAWRNDGGGSSLSLADILEGPESGTDLTPYCLSSKACVGILRRAEKRGKTLPAPLAAALKAAADLEPTSISGGGVVPLNDIEDGLSHALTAKHSRTGRYDPSGETFVSVAHSLRGEGFDASEDGTGRGTPIVPVHGIALRGRDGGATAEMTGDIAPALSTAGGGGNKPHVLAPICFGETQITSAENRCNPQSGDPSHPLAAGARPPAIAFDCKSSGRNGFGVGEVAPTLRAMGHKNSHTNAGGQAAMMSGATVRRLTPRECERLQGFPDDYTRIPYRGGVAADGPRYKALGNSWAVPKFAYVGARIAAVHGAKMKNRHHEGAVMAPGDA